MYGQMNPFMVQTDLSGYPGTRRVDYLVSIRKEMVLRAADFSPIDLKSV